uniref:TspO/MBR-related protein n=1 Tax=Tetradesmus obliquus TaxID=3088 RepID=A0A383VG70_TETOB|eukprot:jgi/Sobl393_1/8455/SZX63396.1
MGAALSLMGAVALPLGSGFAVGLLTQSEIKGWYAGLKKPSWNPPNWLFGPAWSVFYTSMGVASWFVLKQKDSRAVPLSLYAAQLALNLAWTPLFFKQHALDVSLVDSVALLGVATAASVKMAKEKPAVVWPLMAPYLCWVTFATALNVELLRLNPDETAIDYHKVKKDVKETTEKAKQRAKEDTAKVAAAAKDASAKAAEKAKEAGEVVAAKTQEAAAKVADAASEVAQKARHDAAELAAVTKEAFSSSDAPSAPVAEQ